MFPPRLLRLNAASAKAALMALLLLIVALAAIPAQNMIQVRAATYQPHDPIVIDGNEGFTACSCVVAGDGTQSTPYLIENWQINAASANGTVIRNTSAYFVIRNVTISTGRNSTGIVLTDVANGRLANLTIQSTTRTKQAIWMTRVNNTIVQGSILTNYDVAFLMTSVDRVQVLDNIFPSNLGGISLGFSTKVTISRNLFTFNGLVVFGSLRTHLNSHTITPDNLVNGKPLYYYSNCTDLNVDGIQVGQLIIADCSNVRVANLDLSRAEMPLQLIRVRGAVVQNSNISSGTILGFMLSNSTDISVVANSFSDNLVGIRVWMSRDVRVYHNNFVNSRLRHASDDNSLGNQWDNGARGNYWSGYEGSDSDGDGLGDTPYPVYPNTNPQLQPSDRYPLIQPFLPIRDVAITSVVAYPTSATKGDAVTITVEVKNEGNTPERFNVSSYYDTTVIASQTVINLAPGSVMTLDMSWDTTNVTPGEYKVTVTAGVVAGELDTSDNSRTAGIVTVNRVEHAPLLAFIEDMSVDEETLLTFIATATDPNGDPVTFGLAPGAPEGSSITTVFQENRGVFTWTPGENQDGSFLVMVIARDSAGLEDSQDVRVTVWERNVAPVLAPIGDISVDEGKELSFQVNASDEDIPRQTLSFTLLPSPNGDFPEGATITADGVFSMTPDVGMGTRTYAVLVEVSDGLETDSVDISIIVKGTVGETAPNVILSWLPWVSLGLAGALTSLLLVLRRNRNPKLDKTYSQ